MTLDQLLDRLTKMKTVTKIPGDTEVFIAADAMDGVYSADFTRIVEGESKKYPKEWNMPDLFIEIATL